MQVKLEKLLKGFLDAKGYTRIWFLGQIRDYTQSQRMDIVESEINRITSLRLLDALLGAGMRGILFDIVMARRLSIRSMLPSKPGEIYKQVDSLQEQAT